MSWPLASHFSAMLQNPQVAFRDPQLQRAVIEKDAKNQPRPWAGAFAVVYKAVDPQRNEPFAVRIFTSESPERRERYEQISKYLKTRRLRCLCDFEYRDRSIRSAGDGKWYPLILMEWVQGETLFKWVRARCREGNAAALEVIAERWVDAVKELGEAFVAHGDLQHANVMVSDAGEVKLVDYDCLCVPTLVGRRNLEVGVEPYQHPGRNEHTLLSLDLDNFSALMIYVALRALAVNPQLWQKYVEQPGYDKLLFRKEDIQSPQTSSLYYDLLQLPDPELRDLAGQLFALAQARIDQVPALSQLANSYAKVEHLLRSQQWAAAVELLNRRGQFRDAPEHLKVPIRQAYQWVCRQEAWTAYQRIPWEASEHADRSLVDAWNESLFAGFEPAERERVRVAEARRRVAMLERLRYLVQQSSGRMTLAVEKGIVDAAAHLPNGYQHNFSPRVEQARRCVSALARLDRGLSGSESEAAIVAAWRAVQEAKCESLIGPAYHWRIGLAEQRAPLLKSLADMPAALPADQRDRRILDLWNEELLADCPEAEAWRPAYNMAVVRQGALGRLKAALDADNDAAVVAVMQEPCLAGFPLPAAWSQTVKKTQQRIGRLEALLSALRDGQQAAFRELFDARLIRENGSRFEPYRNLLIQWTAAEILPPEAMGLALAVGRASLVPLDEPKGAYRVRWTWPQPRFADQCLLAICANEPAAEDDPEALVAYYRQSLDRPTWEAAGGSHVVVSQADWPDAFAVAWAKVDLGFQVFYSRPLILGQLEKRRFWKWPLFASRRSQTAPTVPEDEPS